MDYIPDYAIIINTEENKSGSDSMPRYQHTKSTWVQQNKQFDARLKDKLRKIRLLIVHIKELEGFLNSKRELPLGTLIDKNYSVFNCEKSLLAMAALCDVSNFAKQFDATDKGLRNGQMTQKHFSDKCCVIDLLLFSMLILHGNPDNKSGIKPNLIIEYLIKHNPHIISSTDKTSPAIKIKVQLQLFKEDDGPNKDRMDWIKDYQLNQLKSGANSLNSSSTTTGGRSTPSRNQSNQNNTSSNNNHNTSSNSNNKTSSDRDREKYNNKSNNSGNNIMNKINSKDSNDKVANQHEPLKEQVSEMTLDDESKVRRGGHRNAMKRKKMVEFRHHKFLLTYFKQPSFCSVCSGFIWGVHQRQAYQCSLCLLACHEKCIQNCVSDCRIYLSKNKSTSSDRSSNDGIKSSKSGDEKERFNIDIPHNWKKTTFYRPTFCSHCGAIVWGGEY